jgi:hypothetical protein
LLASIWFDNAARATTVMGLIAAGIAFAPQKLITAIVGYFVILRGKDAMSRELLRRLNAEKISIASGTYDIVRR